MNRTVKLHLATDNGFPTAVVPSIHLWDLVEYLSHRRTNVRYTYSSHHFYVTFLSLDLPAARQLLNEWVEGLAETPVPAGISSP